MKQTRGFTVIELIFVVLLLGAASIIFFAQKHSLEVTARDDKRKTAINTMYYGLEEIYYKEHSAYPRELNENTLTFVNPDTFIDPSGIALGQTVVKIDDKEYPVESDYRYQGNDCNGDQCKSYTLRSSLENEADFVKKSRH